MRHVPWWLHDIILRGYEGEGDGGEGSTESQEGSESQEETEETGETEEKPPEDLSGLKGALDKERKLNKNNTKLLKQLQKEKADRETAELGETAAAKKQAEDAAGRVTALAAKLKTSAVDSAIVKLATKYKFRDVDDALSQVNRTGIEIEQDEDSPEDVEVDLTTVEAAVKALAEKKKYLIQSEGETDPSGSQFAGERKDKKTLDKEALMKKYPALRGVN